MAGKNELEPKDMPFVTEQIKKGSKVKRWIGKTAKTMLLAMLFGVTAGVSFALVFPYVQKEDKGADISRETITIPRDTQPATKEPESTQGDALENLSATTTENTTPQETESSEPIENVVENVLAERKLTIEDYTAMYHAMYAVVEKVNKSIVTVTVAESELDVFNQTYELTADATGLIYNKTDTELLILADYDEIDTADTIRVTFKNGKECEAVLRKADEVTGMAVLAVDAALLGADLTQYPAAVLGNSYTVKQGDVAMTVGAPFGYNYSMSYGVVTSVENSVQMVDGNYHLINTNILEASTGSGFLINTKGEITGIITKRYKSETAGGITTALAVSDLKGILERLSNGQDISYMGMKGQDVTPDVAKVTGLPKGVYISETVTGSPAYQAGIQSGDVLTEIDGQEIVSMKGFRNAIEGRRMGDTVHMKVLRRGREEYIEIEFDVIVDVR